MEPFDLHQGVDAAFRIADLQREGFAAKSGMLAPKPSWMLDSCRDSRSPTERCAGSIPAPGAMLFSDLTPAWQLGATRS
jgi:hypothetical protein